MNELEQTPPNKKSVPNRAKRFTSEQKAEIVDFIKSTCSYTLDGRLVPVRGIYKEAAVKFGCTPISAKAFFKASIKE